MKRGMSVGCQWGRRRAWKDICIGGWDGREFSKKGKKIKECPLERGMAA
jgi:hypothetical protein